MYHHSYRFSLACVLLLGACAGKPSISEHQCRAGDWESVGYRDGSAGRNSSMILTHQDACGELGIVPERNAYLAGWRDGIAAYCTADRGFNLGRRGGALNTSCSGALKQPFATEYAQGRELYLAEREVNLIQQDINRSEARLVAIDGAMSDAVTDQLIPDLTLKERAELVTELKQLADEKANIKIALPGMYQDLDHALARFENLQQSLAYAD